MILTRYFRLKVLMALAGLLCCHSGGSGDEFRNMQTEAISNNLASWGRWGRKPKKYSGWKNHSNRLIPAYIFGMSLESVSGENNVYRDPERLRQLYGRKSDAPQVEHGTVDYFDQTDIYHLQKAAVESGKRHVILFLFDGMDWQTSWAASIYRTGSIHYHEGRGRGLHFLDYRGVATDFGYFVSSPHSTKKETDVDAQIVLNPGGEVSGGYDPLRGGLTPWAVSPDEKYLIGKSREQPHTVTDSAASATSIATGMKTYNGAINMDVTGTPIEPLARELQRERGWSVGVVTSVPISHATPACMYANNVKRGDHQDITRDMIGLRSVSHRAKPLSGVDVLLGCGWGEETQSDDAQGRNFVPGNRFVTASDIAKIDGDHSGNYHVVQRLPGEHGGKLLAAAVEASISSGQRLFGFFGGPGGHLPYQTADGRFNPTHGIAAAEQYSEADLYENPTLAEMTTAALEVLGSKQQSFHLMIEAGDLDWASHDNNLDNAIGSVFSGDDAFRAVTEWVEKNDCWSETVVIVTADHGHYLVIEDPQAIARSSQHTAQE